MSDRVFIEGLVVNAWIGVHGWEQRQQQRLLLDIELELDLRPAGRSDDLQHTVDYAALSERLTAYCAVARHALIESLAETLCQIVLNEFSVAAIRLRVNKPGALAAANNLGVEIYRPR